MASVSFSSLMSNKTNGLMTKDAILPDWVMKFIQDNEVSRYTKEGMSDLVIMASPVRISKDAFEEARILLLQLEEKMQIKVGLDQLNDMFYVINILIGNSLSQEVFNLKVQALYSVFQSYPALIFNENTCHSLSVLSSFFPSAYEINKVLEKELENFQKRISILKKIIRYGYKL